MINYKDIEQNSLDWFEIKWGKIGGTLAKGLHVNSDTLFLDILSQRLEEFEPSEDSFESLDMSNGNENEPFAREYLEKYTNLKFNTTGWLQSEENELIGISPDGITEDETISCEIKCFARKKHTSVLYENEIPLDNIHQCIHYFTANYKLNKLYFIAFRPQSVKHFIKELTLDSLVNIGTKAKPKLISIKDARDKSLKLANELKVKIDNEINKLKF